MGGAVSKRILSSLRVRRGLHFYEDYAWVWSGDNVVDKPTEKYRCSDLQHDDEKFDSIWNAWHKRTPLSFPRSKSMQSPVRWCINSSAKLSEGGLNRFVPGKVADRVIWAVASKYWINNFRSESKSSSRFYHPHWSWANTTNLSYSCPVFALCGIRSETVTEKKRMLKNRGFVIQATWLPLELFWRWFSFRKGLFMNLLSLTFDLLWLADKRLGAVISHSQLI